MDDKSFLYNYKSKLIIILASETVYLKINIPCEIFFSGKELPLTMEMKGNERIKILEYPEKIINDQSCQQRVGTKPEVKTYNILYIHNKRVWQITA